ncbi:intersectin-2-like [Selaginella moellendorffii]|uniref:intersectin-2-like n=1 Tax=Selaginella moellendorffii TaxID=88036 RepID=UPI000D1C2823|nr:intersectin-2-like [Selaginella moellendorffii]|eukprot:XP_024519513.1 intersectin-2-like [Selaginella moellendorffii]
MARRWAGAWKQCRAMATSAAPPAAPDAAAVTRAALIPYSEGAIRWGGKKYEGPVLGKMNLLKGEYKKQVKEIRKEFQKEVEKKRIAKERSDVAEREKALQHREQECILRWQRKEEKRLKAQERKESLRAIIDKEKRIKAASHARQVAEHQKARDERLEALRVSSSSWIEEKDLEARINEAFVDPIPLLRVGKPLEAYDSFATQVPSPRRPEDPLLRDDDDELLSAFGKKSSSRITGRDILASAARATTKTPF